MAFPTIWESLSRANAISLIHGSYWNLVVNLTRCNYENSHPCIAASFAPAVLALLAFPSNHIVILLLLLPPPPSLLLTLPFLYLTRFSVDSPFHSLPRWSLPPWFALTIFSYYVCSPLARPWSLALSQTLYFLSLPRPRGNVPSNEHWPRLYDSSRVLQWCCGSLSILSSPYLIVFFFFFFYFYFFLLRCQE